ncbi:Na+ ABC transporter, ATP-binding component [synthetic Mycoplasma mycoides JCVI-syn1.0]|uniref:Na+ ABC transporter ATP-binding protein n=1 Tax=Mycoplasma mycoides subsp. capri TaxID=40477 RepID=A0AB38GE00_MYCMC|nr:ABC transporter ATP-binding protein [Mycoplasma mycoides]ADH21580.1 Na+ ABC transporter, ATP-binding component [synthetic Mycoplasma mycoides JCVI-syn1.0]ACU78476.1 Na+ ABC transporter, ATP-binding component [Mycoplasma mycoides subsp. capri str. GM12]ACU79306.1 Na+ ABC transporter, ATP-binding component [Mycoplasma mycoides subsp. capri str. GM12]SRX58726.1 Na+ ABC transporter ATP-binding protein [Mycoplasma mycoides subsp. capri]SRX61446.1 Na+ ABC transporter ATP-binding protein [Mycoplas
MKNVSKNLHSDVLDEKYSIVVDNFYKKFKDIEIGPFSFNVEKGKITALLGTSGSGKSVFINSLLGTSINYQGNIFINKNERKKNNSIENNSDIGFYSQMDFSLYSISAYDFLYNMCYVMGLEDKLVKDKLEYWLKRFDLWESKDKPLKSFSWGMKNRINLILCFIKEPKILVCDEPGANLDSYWRKEIYTILNEFKKNFNTIILTVHNIDEVYDIIDNFIILEKGKLLFCGTKQELNLYKKTKITFKNNISLQHVEQILNKNDILTFNINYDQNSLVVGLKEFQTFSDVLDLLKKHDFFIKSIESLSIDIDMIKKALEDKNTINVKYQKNSLDSLNENLDYNNTLSLNKTITNISNITNLRDSTSTNYEVEILNNNNNNNNLLNNNLEKTFLHIFDEIKNLKQQVNQNDLDTYQILLDDLKAQINDILQIKTDFLKKVDQLNQQNNTFNNSETNLKEILELKDFIKNQVNKIEQTLFIQSKNMNDPCNNKSKTHLSDSDLTDQYLDLKNQINILKTQINHNYSNQSDLVNNYELNQLKSEISAYHQDLEQFKKELYFEKILDQKLESFDNKLKEKESVLELNRLKQEIKEEQNKLRELLFLEKLVK